MPSSGVRKGPSFLPFPSLPYPPRPPPPRRHLYSFPSSFSPYFFRQSLFSILIAPCAKSNLRNWRSSSLASRTLPTRTERPLSSVRPTVHRSTKMTFSFPLLPLGPGLPESASARAVRVRPASRLQRKFISSSSTSSIGILIGRPRPRLSYLPAFLPSFPPSVFLCVDYNVIFGFLFVRSFVPHSFHSPLRSRGIQDQPDSAYPSKSLTHEGITHSRA